MITMQFTGSYPRAEWISRTNIYEVNTRQYTDEGTFTAFARHLPRLRHMGVETLWLMPVTPIATKKMKGAMGSPYACSDYTSVNPQLGSMEDLKTLVMHAHGMGFRIIIDWVANHTGWDHVWTISNPEFYKRDSSTGEFLAASGMDDIIELDYSNSAMRTAMIDAMRFWITELGIDGFRCDLASWVQLDFWKEARTELEKTKNLFWLAEMDPVENPDYMEVFDAAYAWKWMHRTADFYKNLEPAGKLLNLLQEYKKVMEGGAIPLWFTSNHDENSWNGTEYEKYGEAALPLAVHSLTWDGIPLIYSGQELPNYKRLAFFEKDQIAWKGDHKMASFYETMLALRKHNNALSVSGAAGNTVLLMDENAPSVIAYLRQKDEQQVLVILNMGNKPVTFQIEPEVANGNYRNVFFQEAVLELPSQIPVNLQPWQYLVFEKF